VKEKIYRPEWPLSSIVKFIWYNDGYEPTSRIERVLPGISSQIIINLGRKSFRHFKTSDVSRIQEFDNVLLAGMQTGYIFLDPYTRISTMGMVLHYGALPALFGVPAGEFRDQVVSLRDLIGSEIYELREKLIEVPTVNEKFSLAEAFLMRRLDGKNTNLNPAVEAAITQIGLSNGKIPITDILDQIGYSRRWFSEIFRNSVGVNPKQFGRLCRFQSVIKSLRNEKSLQFAELAVQTGYFDQSHFIHDFQDLGGISPMEYYRHQGGAANHLNI